MNTPLFDNDQSEQAFREWQKVNHTVLVRYYAEYADEYPNFDKFCLAHYTGRLQFNLDIKK